MTARVTSYITDDLIQKAATSAEGTIECKFVCLRKADELHMILGPVSLFPYHANLLERFSDEQGIATSWVQLPDVLEVLDRDIKTRGGGLLEYDCRREAVKIHGFSRAYGPFAPEEVDGVVASDDFFRSRKVTVRKSL
ncbi:MAG: hypothetical protein KKA42_14575 [candidate division Zixibacteria bacterium]|nr:hypothetical protein [candidate division Zixibacteria bacterium]